MSKELSAQEANKRILKFARYCVELGIKEGTYEVGENGSGLFFSRIDSSFFYRNQTPAPRWCFFEVISIESGNISRIYDADGYEYLAKVSHRTKAILELVQYEEEKGGRHE